MKTSSLAIASMCAFSISAVSTADTYRAEVGSAYKKFDSDQLFNSGHAVGLAVYFSDVDTTKGPLREAAFLNKSSGVSVTQTKIDYELSIPNGVASAIGTRIVTNYDMIFQASYLEFGEFATYDLGIGTYLTDTTDLVFNYGFSEIERSNESFELSLHHVANNIAFTVEGAYISSDRSSDALELGGDITYYANNQLGLGLLASRELNDNDDLTTLGVFAQYFITNNIQIESAFSRPYDNSNSNEYDITASVRF